MNSSDSDQDFDLPAGFLIKDKSGQFKKVQDDTIVDFTVKKTVRPPLQPQQPQQNKPPVQPLRSASMPPRPASAPLREFLPVKPPSPISSSSNASAFMEPDDEREIREQQAKLEQMMKPPAGSSVVSVEDIVNNAISDFSLSFADEVMHKRFAKIIESRLRDLRDSVETKEALIRSKKIGGLELPPEQADQLLASIERHLSGKPVIKQSEPEVVRALRPDVPPDFIPRPQPVQPVPQAPAAPEEPKEVVKLVEEIKKQMAAPVPQMQPKQPPQPPPVSTPDIYSRPADELPHIVQVRKLETERPQVNDIRRPARVMGPVEELADIDLDEFRRQGTNPIEAAERVVEKIDLLEHDSWEMKIAGTKAWKRSEANKLYIDIGRESIETGQTVADVIRKRMQEKRSHLLLDEFLAINYLNSRLVI